MAVRMPGGLDQAPEMDFEEMAGALAPGEEALPKAEPEPEGSAHGSVREMPGPFPIPEDDSEYENYVPRKITLPPPTLRPGETPGGGMPMAGMGSGMGMGPGMGMAPPAPGGSLGAPDDDILSSIMAGVTKPIGGGGF